MIKDVYLAIGAASKKILSNWGVLMISLLIYGALIGVLYFFFTLSEATIWEIVLSLLILPLAAIFLFFLLQALGVSYVRIGVGPFYLLRRAAKDCWKIFLVTLPVIVIVGLLIYLGGKLETYLYQQMAGSETDSGEWRLNVLNWVRFLILYFIAPLASIHLWISAVREGVAGTFMGIIRNVISAFSPRSVLIYLVVIALFGVASYYLIFTRIELENAWMELWVFGIRQASGLLLIFFGWFITLGALAEMTAQRALSETES